MFNRLPALARFLFALIAIDLVVFAAFRAPSWAGSTRRWRTRPLAICSRPFISGSSYDLRLALLLCLPLALLGWIAPFDPARRRAARIAWIGVSRCSASSCCCSIS